MALPLMHTLSRNASRDQILAGKYGQIRIHVSLPLRFHAVRLSFLCLFSADRLVSLLPFADDVLLRRRATKEMAPGQH